MITALSIGRYSDTLAVIVEVACGVGALGVVWSIMWLFLVFDTPAKHPRIEDKERQYIEHSQGLLAGADEHVVRCQWRNKGRGGREGQLPAGGQGGAKRPH